MANKVPITPGVPRGPARDQLAAFGRALDASNLASQRTGAEHAQRINNSFPMDGTERMEAPLPLQRLTTAELPPAAEHGGDMAFDTTRNRVVQSNGVTWEPIPTPDEISQAAFDEVTDALTPTDTIEVVVVEEPPDIQLHVKAESITSVHLAPNSVGPAELAPSGVVAGQYTNPDLAIDQDGRITGAIGGAATAFVRLGGNTITSSIPTLDIIFGASIVATPFRHIIIMLGGIVPVTDDVSFHAQFSTDGGSVFVNTGYKYASLITADDGTAFNQFSAGLGTSWFLSSSGTATTMVGNLAREGWSGMFHIQNWQNTALNPRMTWDGVYHAANAGEAAINVRGSGGRATASGLNALRFFFSGGNIASGIWDVYGLR
jgi:hypothetical protein